MVYRRFKPKLDKLYYLITIPTALMMLVFTVVPLLLDPEATGAMLGIILPCDLLVGYFVVTPLVGYVELREDTVFIKYGFILKREIPYSALREVTIGRGIVSESMLSLKNAMEHVTIRYNRFDVTIVSVVGNEELAEELDHRRLS